MHNITVSIKTVICISVYLDYLCGCFANMKVLMVCLGNICRSPLAQGILEHQTRLHGLVWEVDSAGTSAYHVGETPHRLSCKVASLNGIDISKQRARQFCAKDMDYYDRIFVMDTDNLRMVKELSGDRWQPSKTSLLLDVLENTDIQNVPDPWYGEEENYHAVYKLIQAACEKIVLNNITRLK
jgi:protein-tyrosine phosphatase